jgi:putative adenylate-forming enzyme
LNIAQLIAIRLEGTAAIADDLDHVRKENGDRMTDVHAGKWGMLHAARAFATARWRAARFRTREAVALHRARGLDRMMRKVVPHIPRYAATDRFADLPVIDKAVVLADFARFNRAGIELDAVRAAIASGASHIRGHSFGQSTGTSGNRGYYIVSDIERFTWLGTILAKALPDALWRRHRVALALPGLSSLYASAHGGSRVKLDFYDLAEGVDSWGDRLAAAAPDTIVAPPKVLRALAERGQLPARHIFSGAEVLDLLDRTVIEAATGARVREIYMATEGLFGVACPHGHLHLAEDVVAFEWEAAGGGLVSPIVTDFTRTTQLMPRYRMNDLLALSDEPCACGSPYQRVDRIEGRQDDVFVLPARDGGGTRLVTPDVLRNAVVDSDPRIDDFRVVQTGPAHVEVAVPLAVPLDAPAAALAALFAKLGIGDVAIIRRDFDTATDRKLRRVRCEWRNGG